MELLDAILSQLDASSRLPVFMTSKLLATALLRISPRIQLTYPTPPDFLGQHLRELAPFLTEVLQNRQQPKLHLTLQPTSSLTDAVEQRGETEPAAAASVAARLVARMLGAVPLCGAVDCLTIEWHYPLDLPWEPAFSATLAASFPSLTSLTFSCGRLSIAHLANAINHPLLLPQLLHLDINGITITHQGQPGRSPFIGSRLQTLSLDADVDVDGQDELLYGLVPLPPTLTQLVVSSNFSDQLDWGSIAAAVSSLTQLQQLRLTDEIRAYYESGPGLIALLPALAHLPRLHTLQMSEFEVGQEQLDALLALTQITHLSIMKFSGLTSSRASAACSWRQLEVNTMDWVTAAYLPLHNLTHPLHLHQLVGNMMENFALGNMMRYIEEPSIEVLAAAELNLCERNKAGLVLDGNLCLSKATVDLLTEQYLSHICPTDQQPPHPSVASSSSPEGHITPGGPGSSTGQGGQQGSAAETQPLMQRLGRHVKELRITTQGEALLSPANQQALPVLFPSPMEKSSAADVNKGKQLQGLQALPAEVLSVVLSQLDASSQLPVFRTSKILAAALLRVVPRIQLTYPTPHDFLGQHLRELAPSLTEALQMRQQPKLRLTLQPASCLTDAIMQRHRAEPAAAADAAHLVAWMLGAVPLCGAVDSLTIKWSWDLRLPWKPAFSATLAASFPSLTSLTFSCGRLSIGQLATAINHPLLLPQLLHLDIDGITITHKGQPGRSPFIGSRLQTLSLDADVDVDGEDELLSGLVPLPPTLTQLVVKGSYRGSWDWDRTAAAVSSLTQLEQLRLTDENRGLYETGLGPMALLSALAHLPRLHTLQMSEYVVGHEQLDALLALTQITHLSIMNFSGLTSSRASAACSWRQLEVNTMDWVTAAYLPLHNLTHPLHLHQLVGNMMENFALGNMMRYIEEPSIEVLAAAELNLCENNKAGLVLDGGMCLSKATVDLLTEQHLSHSRRTAQHLLHPTVASNSSYSGPSTSLPSSSCPEGHITPGGPGSSTGQGVQQGGSAAGAHPLMQRLGRDVKAVRIKKQGLSKYCLSSANQQALDVLFPNADVCFVPIWFYPVLSLGHVADALGQVGRAVHQQSYALQHSSYCFASFNDSVGLMEKSSEDEVITGQQLQGLQGLPANLLDAVLRQLDASSRLQVFRTSKLLATALLRRFPRIQLTYPTYNDTFEHYLYKLAPFPTEVLQNRHQPKLHLTLRPDRMLTEPIWHRQRAEPAAASAEAARLVAWMLRALPLCGAVDCLTISWQWDLHLPWRPGFSPALAASFPSLTSLTFQEVRISIGHLATAINHPLLLPWLRHLDLVDTDITHESDLGMSPFVGSRLQELSLLGWVQEDGELGILPGLEPLPPTLTQLAVAILIQEGEQWDWVRLSVAVSSLTQLQQLRLTDYEVGHYLVTGPGLMALLSALAHLPSLHTLVVDELVVGQEQLDALLELTQITCLEVHGFSGLTSSRASAACSWRQLKVRVLEWVSAAYLPLHSLTHPLQLHELVEDMKGFSLGDEVGAVMLAAAALNLCERNKAGLVLDDCMCLSQATVDLLTEQYLSHSHTAQQPLQPLQPTVASSSSHSGPSTSTSLVSGSSRLVGQQGVSAGGGLALMQRLGRCLKVLRITLKIFDVARLSSANRQAFDVLFPTAEIGFVQQGFYPVLSLGHVADALGQVGRAVHQQSYALQHSSYCFASFNDSVGLMEKSSEDEVITGQQLQGLQGLPANLLDAVLRQLDASSRLQVFRTSKLLATALLRRFPRIQLTYPTYNDTFEHYLYKLAPFPTEVLQNRHQPKLHLTLRPDRMLTEPIWHRQRAEPAAASAEAARLVAWMLRALPLCGAVDCLTISWQWDLHLPWRPGFSPALAASFPSLTSLTFQEVRISIGHLATAINHPLLLPWLRHLDLVDTDITHESDLGMSPFVGSRLQELSLLGWVQEDGELGILPGLEPLPPTLTQLAVAILIQEGEQWDWVRLSVAVSSLTQLQQLRLTDYEVGHYLVTGPGLMALLSALAHLPSLHTLVVDELVVGQEQLDALLELTQITCLEVHGFSGLTSSRASAACSWRQLKVRVLEWVSAAYLPLHSLTHPLQLHELVEDMKGFSLGDEVGAVMLAAAALNLCERNKAGLVLDDCMCLSQATVDLLTEQHLSHSHTAQQPLQPLQPTVASSSSHSGPSTSTSLVSGSSRLVGQQGVSAGGGLALMQRLGRCLKVLRITLKEFDVARLSSANRQALDVLFPTAEIGFVQQGFYPVLSLGHVADALGQVSRAVHQQSYALQHSSYCFASFNDSVGLMEKSSEDEVITGQQLQGLQGLPANLLDAVLCQLDANSRLPVFMTSKLLAAALLRVVPRIQLTYPTQHDIQRDNLRELASFLTEVLQNREQPRLHLTLHPDWTLTYAIEQRQRAEPAAAAADAVRLVARMLGAVPLCGAVDSLTISWLWYFRLPWEPDFSAALATSFPSLTSLNFQQASISIGHLATAINHPLLMPRLLHLDLVGAEITHEGHLGTSLLIGSRLQELSLCGWVEEDGELVFLPGLEPLPPTLTQLAVAVWVQEGEQRHWVKLSKAVSSLTQLQQLRLIHPKGRQCDACVTITSLLSALAHLPSLHTLVVDVSEVSQEQLDALLELTQITRLEVYDFSGLTSSRASAACSWRQLEVRRLHWVSAAYLPLHSLTHPLWLQQLGADTDEPSIELLAAAELNLCVSNKAGLVVDWGHLYLSMATLNQLTELYLSHRRRAAQHLVHPTLASSSSPEGHITPGGPSNSSGSGGQQVGSAAGCQALMQRLGCHTASW
ncbi:hypothetical protein QJQ45_026728 [Haematococcus lacustris]|nr:hypothetical protein QJQ45_026728 [Haematococcus lacustris]